MLEGKAEIEVKLPGGIDVHVTAPLGADTFQSVCQVLLQLAGIMVKTDDDSEPNEPSGS